MLTKVIFENFKSFKNKTIVDFNKTDNELLDDLNTYNNILKGVFIYGSNATGKTGILLVIQLLLDLFKDSKNINYQEYKYLNNKKEMNFEYYFTFNDKEYIYFLSLDKNIKEEKLIINNTCYYHKKNRDTLYLKELKKDNEIQELYSFLDNSISFNVSLFSKDDTTYNKLYDYLNKYGDKNINKFLKDYQFPYSIEFSDKLYFIRNKMKIDFNYESYGNKMLMNLLAIFDLLIKNKGMLLIDEFSNSLHNKLEELLIKHFFKEVKDSQIFVVSHSTNLLKMSLLRLDQVYIVDMNEEGSYVNRLSNENIRLSQNIEKMYLSGVFGGVPLYDKTEQE